MSEGNWNLPGPLSIHVQAGPCLLVMPREQCGSLHRTPAQHMLPAKEFLAGSLLKTVPTFSVPTLFPVTYIARTICGGLYCHTLFRSRSHRRCRPGVGLCPSQSASVLDISPFSVSFQEICPTLFCVQGAYHACPRPGGDCPHRGSGP